MRFRVTRTSGKYGDAAPCVGVTLGDIEQWDIRTYELPEEHDAREEGSWAGRGTNHQVRRGPRGEAIGIKRQMASEPAWFIDIESLEALMALHAEHGALVIETDERDGDIPTIEIYDGWRE